MITNCELQIALGLMLCITGCLPNFKVSVLTIAMGLKRPGSVAEVHIELPTTRTLYVSGILGMTGTSRRSIRTTPKHYTHPRYSYDWQRQIIADTKMTSDAPKPEGREKAHNSHRRCRFGTKCCMYTSRRMFSKQFGLLQTCGGSRRRRTRLVHLTHGQERRGKTR